MVNAKSPAFRRTHRGHGPSRRQRALLGAKLRSAAGRRRRPRRVPFRLVDPIHGTRRQARRNPRYARQRRAAARRLPHASVVAGKRGSRPRVVSRAEFNVRMRYGAPDPRWNRLSPRQKLQVLRRELPYLHAAGSVGPSSLPGRRLRFRSTPETVSNLGLPRYSKSPWRMTGLDAATHVAGKVLTGLVKQAGKTDQGRVVSAGLSSGPGKAVTHGVGSALESIGRVTGAPGRAAAKWAHAPASSRLAFEVLLDPTTYVGGDVLKAKRVEEAYQSARRLEQAGVQLHRIKSVQGLTNKAVRSGDASDLADRLKALEHAVKRGGRRAGPVPSPTERAATAARGEGRSGPVLMTHKPRKVFGTSKRLTQEPSRPLPSPSSEQMVSASVSNAIKQARRPGFKIHAMTPLGAPIKPHIGIPVPLPRRLQVPVSRRLLPSVLEGRKAVAREAVSAEHAPQIRTLERSIRDAKVAGHDTRQLERQLGHTKRLVKSAHSDINAAVDQQHLRLAGLGEITAAKNQQHVAHAAIRAGGAIGRTTRGTINENFERAIEPLRHVYKRAELERALGRVQMRAEEHVGSLVKVLPREHEVLGLTHAQQTAERAAEENLRKLYHQVGTQGTDLGFLRGLRENYAGQHIFKGGGHTDQVEALTKGMRSGGEGFTKERAHTSAFEIFDKDQLGRAIEHNFGVGRQDAGALADKLHRFGRTRFHAEELARRLQRGEHIAVEDLAPAEKRAVQEWSSGPVKLFRNPRDPAAEGQVLLAPTDKRLEDAFRQVDTPHEHADLLASSMARHKELARAATASGDAKLAAEAHATVDRLGQQLDELYPGVASDVPPWYQKPPKAGLGEGNTKDLANARQAVDEALQTIHPALFHEHPSEGPLRVMVTDSPSERTFATYEPHLHRIRVNAAHAPIHDPEALRSILIHELAHARTLNPGGSLAALERMRYGGKSLSRLAQQTQRPVESVRSEVARGTLDASLGQPHVFDRFLQARSALVKERGTQIARRISGAKYDFTGQAPRSLWDQTVMALSRIEGSYKPAIKEYGKEYVLTTETSARYMELLALDPERFKQTVGADLYNWLEHDVLRVQAAELRPEALAGPNTLSYNPKDGMLWLKQKDQVLDTASEQPHMNHASLDVDPLEDPSELLGKLPDLRGKGLVTDPREIAYVRASAQGRVVSMRAMWKSIDEHFGRNSQDLQRISPEGTPADQAIWFDRVAQQEYVQPAPRLADQEQGQLTGLIGDQRVWPTQMVTDTLLTMRRYGELKDYQRIERSGIGAGLNQVLSQIRFGVTVPFPAYHLRNMFSDLLKSLQADSGVVFHPLVNLKLLAAPFRRTRSLVHEIDVPGIGKLKSEDFLLFADQFGVRSGEHLAEFGQIFQAGKAAGHAPGAARDLGRRAQRWLLNHGAKREDTVRMMTFLQRMRRNGGDAADAAWWSIHHHFDYADLTLAEKRVVRNVFLFYTWYRKNIPVQLLEIARRPGFFAGLTDTYYELPRGGTPINQDFSKLYPGLPDLSQDVTKQNPDWMPDYVRNRLLALPMSWNGHAVYFGFGAPWADLNYVSTEGVQQGGRQLLNPFIQLLAQLGWAAQDPLTGRPLRQQEPSNIAEMLQAAGIPIAKDRFGRAVLPWWLNSVLNSVPLAGRGSQIFQPAPAKYDESALPFFLRRAFSNVTGVTDYPLPKRGTPQFQKAETSAAFLQLELLRQKIVSVSNQSGRDAVIHRYLHDLYRSKPDLVRAMALITIKGKHKGRGHKRTIKTTQDKVRQFLRDTRSFPTFYAPHGPKKKKPPRATGPLAPSGGGGDALSPGSSGGDALSP